MKKLIPLLVIVIFTLLVVLVSCAQKTPSVLEIVNSAVAAATKVDTYRYDLDMKTDYKYDVTTDALVGGNATRKIDVALSLVGRVESDQMDVSGIIAVTKKQIQVNIDYDASLQGQPMRQLLSLELVTIGNESLMKVVVPSGPSSGEHWSKTGLDVWEYLDQATQQIDLLKTATEVELWGMENVDGIDCYILKNIPDSEKLARWLSRQLALISFGNVQAKKEELLSFSIRLWIAKDSYLLTKTEFEIKHRDRDGDNDIKGQLNFYDYNQPVSITIPQEAREARN